MLYGHARFAASGALACVALSLFMLACPSSVCKQSCVRLTSHASHGMMEPAHLHVVEGVFGVVFTVKAALAFYWITVAHCDLYSFRILSMLCCLFMWYAVISIQYPLR